jgi:lipid II:glycine glycyltransferase (peptidoglycan interpeptide bridge formation enzyme)
VSSEAALDEALARASAAARNAGAYRLLAEPSLPITPEQAETRFTRQLPGFQPSRTQIIDLSQDENEIIAQMSTTRRKQWRSSANKGMSFSESSSKEDFDEGVRLLEISANKKSFAVRDSRYFSLFWKHLVQPGIARVFIARLEGEIQVVSFVVDDDDTRYYLYVGRDLSNNSLQVSAPFITFMILHAKSQGLKYFDLCGISARDDVTDEMSGFTAFKRTFGGQTVQYAGSWDVGIRPLKYSIRQAVDGFRSLGKKTTRMRALCDDEKKRE